MLRINSATWQSRCKIIRLPCCPVVHQARKAGGFRVLLSERYINAPKAHKIVKRFYFGIAVDPFDEISRSLQAHPSKAQILLEVEDEGKTLEDALRFLKGLGIQSIEYEVILKGDHSIVLFYLSANDMRSTVLKLTEAGFARIKGINAKGAHLK